MSLTRKHFQRIAAGLSYTMPPDRCHSMKAQWEATVDEMADAMQELGQNFNRQQFLTACHDRTYWQGKL